MKKVMKYIEKIKEEKGIWNYIVLHANNIRAAEWYKREMEALTGIKPVSVVNISPVIGANAGIGSASVALLHD
jgi:fatty acid-binding protein DegV